MGTSPRKFLEMMIFPFRSMMNSAEATILLTVSTPSKTSSLSPRLASPPHEYYVPEHMIEQNPSNSTRRSKMHQDFVARYKELVQMVKYNLNINMTKAGVQLYSTTVHTFPSAHALKRQECWFECRMDQHQWELTPWAISTCCVQLYATHYRLYKCRGHKQGKNNESVPLGN